MSGIKTGKNLNSGLLISAVNNLIINVMVQIAYKKPFRGLMDPLPNLDPGKNLKFDNHDLTICRKCLTLYGSLVHILSESPTGTIRSGWRYQKCSCMKKEDDKNGVKVRLWPGNNFNTSVEFCHCCSKELINTGSKFSSFYCDDCKKLISEHNNQPGNIQIPMGRHSFMNGIKMGIPFSKKEEIEFTLNLNIFFKSIDLVSEWQELCLFENLHDLGFRFTNDIALPYYDKLIQEPEKNKFSYFAKMLEYIKTNQ
jgi:hypothetical protein